MQIPVKTAKSKKVIKRIFLVGILVRILVMPWFAHGDLLIVHERAESIACGTKTLLDYGAIGVHFLESFFLKLFSPINPCSVLSEIPNDFYQAEHINRLIFFFKFPYLLFEIGFWYLICKVINPAKEKVKKQLAVFLALNPVAIYSIYLFGRFEAYNLFLTALLLFILDKKKLATIKKSAAAAFTFMILLTVRQSYLLIFPALLAAIGSVASMGLLTLIGLGGFGLVFIASGRGLSSLINFIRSGHHAGYFFNAGFNTGENRIVYLFFLGIGLIFIWTIHNWDKLKTKPPIYKFSLFSSLILSIFYATSVFHPQYLTWILPFLAVLIFKYNYKFLYTSFWFLISAYFLYLLSWGKFTTFALLFPVSELFMQIEPGWYSPIYTPQVWGSIGRSIISAFGIYWAYYLTKIENKNA
jgi:hypothetical protein